MIKKIKDLYSRYIGHAKEREDFLKDIMDPDENYINFVLRDSQLLIRISIQDVTDLNAITFGETLFCLSKGLYTIEAMKILQDLKQQDPARGQFVDVALNKFHDLLAKSKESSYYNSEGPLVSPSSFMKRDANNGTQLQ